MDSLMDLLKIANWNKKSNNKNHPNKKNSIELWSLSAWAETNQPPTSQAAANPNLARLCFESSRKGNFQRCFRVFSTKNAGCFTMGSTCESLEGLPFARWGEVSSYKGKWWMRTQVWATLSCGESWGKAVDLWQVSMTLENDECLDSTLGLQDWECVSGRFLNRCAGEKFAKHGELEPPENAGKKTTECWVSAR